MKDKGSPAESTGNSAGTGTKETVQLKRLSRVELLELLTEMSEELEKTRAERDELAKKLQNKEIKIRNAGSIAAASLGIFEIFETAQKAADVYLENVKALYDEKYKGAGKAEPADKEPAEEEGGTNG